MKVVCAQCGNEREIYKSNYIPKKKYFCNKHCYGRYFGLKYGHVKKNTRGKMPKTKEELAQDMKSPIFTTREFVTRYNTSFSYGYINLKQYKINGWITYIRKGTYRII